MSKFTISYFTLAVLGAIFLGYINLPEQIPSRYKLCQYWETEQRVKTEEGVAVIKGQIIGKELPKMLDLEIFDFESFRYQPLTKIQVEPNGKFQYSTKLTNGVKVRIDISLPFVLSKSFFIQPNKTIELEMKVRGGSENKERIFLDFSYKGDTIFNSLLRQTRSQGRYFKRLTENWQLLSKNPGTEVFLKIDSLGATLAKEIEQESLNKQLSLFEQNILTHELLFHNFYSKSVYLSMNPKELTNTLLLLYTDSLKLLGKEAIMIPYFDEYQNINHLTYSNALFFGLSTRFKAENSSSLENWTEMEVYQNLFHFIDNFIETKELKRYMHTQLIRALKAKGTEMDILNPFIIIFQDIYGQSPF